MFLSKVNLKNFRSITSLTLDNLKNLNCFIGGHNSGKTNILDGISVFWDPQIRTFSQQRQFQAETTPITDDFDRSILSYLDTHHIHGSFDFTLDHHQGLQPWKDNELLKQNFIQTAFKYKIINPFEVYEYFLDDLGSIVDLTQINTLEFNLTLNPGFLEFLKESLHLKLRSDEIINYESVNVPVPMIRDALGITFIRRFHDMDLEYELLRTTLLDILQGRDHHSITSIEDFLKDVIDQDFVFQIGGSSPDRKPQIDVTIERSFSSPLWRISSGTIRLIALACLLTSDPTNGQIIILDNPGLFLHPRGERGLARKLETFAKDRQFFFSTHSSRLLIGHAHLVELKNGWTNIEHIRGRKSMGKIVKLLGIRPSDSFGSDIVVFVEGRTDSRVFRIFEDKICRTLPELSRVRVSYVGVGGWTNIKYVLSIELLKSKFVRSRALAITDGDIIESPSFDKVKQNWLDVFHKEGDFFSLQEECIESLFLNNPQVFVRLSKEKGKNFPPVSEIEDFILKRSSRGLSDKSITREIVIKYNIARKYSSSLAEKLARQFKVGEIPIYLVEFYKTQP
ncbi:MAG: ATP-dependent nuclease [Candidatus Hodarchaeales archaeon]|jgi:predicted ATP-dependent endonuclease of OLD family